MGTSRIAILILLVVLVSEVRNADAQATYKVCATDGNTQECQALERGNSNVVCTKVTDRIDCLLKMNDGKADFSIMSPEELILATLVKPDKFDVVASVRQMDRRYNEFQFQSVVLVLNNYTGGIAGLKGGSLCHPGYGKAKEQLWSDRVLKYFERKTAGGLEKCDPNSKSSAEDDARDLSKFFGDACRPGPWLVDPVEDKALKDKYPSLCTLCTSNRSPDCDGYRYFEPKTSPGTGVNSHLSAIGCLTSRKGSMAYVAYKHVQDYFKSNRDDLAGYALLCENGTTVALSEATLTSEAPCAWVHQPWGVIMARKEVSESIFEQIQKWMPSGRGTGQSWIESLDAILFKETTDVLEYPKMVIDPRQYITDGRPMPTPLGQCHNSLRWCTVNDEEQNKCSWVKSASLTLGIQPEITCVQGSSQLDCLSMIKENRADFISADSNLGFIARKYYNVSAVLYHETTRTQTSKVFAVIKEEHKGTITRFENLRDKNACFPEYGGIGWVAFMRTAHERSVISSQECDYANEVVNFFNSACAPGSLDPAHYPSKAADPGKLCQGCSGFSPKGGNEQGIVSQNIATVKHDCPADPSNDYYGNRGALRCLAKPDAHVAFIEGQNLKEHAANLSLEPKNFRILCRNGSLASSPGFDVDDRCALSVTIDSEVLSRRNEKNKLNLQLYLQELDEIFGYNQRSTLLIDFEVFSPFNDSKNLLFKDSTIGLDKSNSENEFVINYIELFKHTEGCTGGAYNAVVPSLMLLIIVTFIQLARGSYL